MSVSIRERYASRDIWDSIPARPPTLGSSLTILRICFYFLDPLSLLVLFPDLREGGVTAQHILSLVSPAVLVACPFAMHGCALKNNVMVDGRTPIPAGLPKRTPPRGTWIWYLLVSPAASTEVGRSDCQGGLEIARLLPGELGKN
jgi:hypothetical protein